MTSENEKKSVQLCKGYIEMKNSLYDDKIVKS